VPLTEIQSVIKESLATGESGEFRSEHVSLRLCLESACAVAKEQQVNVALHGPSEIYIQGSEMLLYQAFEELVNNAVYWMEGCSRKELEIVVKRAAPAEVRNEPFDDFLVAVTIQDSGIGIQRADRLRVFEGGYTTRPQSDLPRGLGLAQVREIIEAHRGTIEIRDGFGSGACFVVYLPSVI